MSSPGVEFEPSGRARDWPLLGVILEIIAREFRIRAIRRGLISPVMGTECPGTGIKTNTWVWKIGTVVVEDGDTETSKAALYGAHCIGEHCQICGRPIASRKRGPMPSHTPLQVVQVGCSKPFGSDMRRNYGTGHW